VFGFRKIWGISSLAEELSTHMKFGVVTTVDIEIAVSWIMVPRSFVPKYQRFGVTCCRHYHVVATKMNSAGFSETLAPV
jgi:hypothetical protein